MDRNIPAAWPMVLVCVGGLLPWTEAGRSGLLGDGRYALVLGVIGLMLRASSTTWHPGLLWWRLASLPLALACLGLAASALNGYGALGALVTAAAATAWLVSSWRVAEGATHRFPRATS